MLPFKSQDNVVAALPVAGEFEERKQKLIEHFRTDLNILLTRIYPRAQEAERYVSQPIDCVQK